MTKDSLGIDALNLRDETKALAGANDGIGGIDFTGEKPVSGALRKGVVGCVPAVSVRQESQYERITCPMGRGKRLCSVEVPIAIDGVAHIINVN